MPLPLSPIYLPLRILARLDFVDHPTLATPCWLWTGSTSGEGKGGGYGRIRWLGCTVAVHRLVWFLLTGRWPRRQLDHRCERRACCNPDHEEEVSNKVNSRRRVRRWRKDGKL